MVTILFVEYAIEFLLDSSHWTIGVFVLLLSGILTSTFEIWHNILFRDAWCRYALGMQCT